MLVSSLLIGLVLPVSIITVLADRTLDKLVDKGGYHADVSAHVSFPEMK